MLQFWLTGLSLLSLPFWWGEPDKWVFESAAPLESITGYDEIHVNATLSLDGSTLAWQGDNATCVYRFADASTDCFAWPDEARLRAMRSNVATISPDGRTVALTENLTHLFMESDIWLLDTQTGEVVNRTDDGIYGSPLVGEGEVSPPLDYLPIFHPVTGDVYFFRSLRYESANSNSGYTLVLYRLAVDGGEPESVYDFRSDLTGALPVYSPPAFSADGTKLAILVMPPNALSSSDTGVWVLDIAVQQFEQVATLSQVKAALPDWEHEGALLSLVQWVGDDLIVWAENRFARAIPYVPFVVDTELRGLSTLVDYTPFDNEQDYRNAAGETLTVYDTLMAGIAAPGDDAYWIIARNSTPSDAEYGLLRLPLPGGEGEPEVVMTVDQPRLLFEAPPSASTDGKLLLLNNLLTFAGE